MKTRAYSRFEELTSDKKLPVIQALKVRQEELRRYLIEVREPGILARIQGQAEEVDLLLAHLEK